MDGITEIELELIERYLPGILREINSQVVREVKE